jgi:putative ABC transport system ATP-binding protein
MIECKNLSLSFKDGNKVNNVLSGVNLKIEKGENVVLLGPSGSGKSSLIYLLSGLKKPSGGDIFFEGENVGELNDKDISVLRRKKFGFIFQMHFLIPYMKVIENVMTGAPQFNEKYRERALMVLGELGIDQYVNKKIYQLSGGERQRVAIARALVSAPDVIFADEPTASLDHENSVEIIKLLKDYKENSTLIMATHDTSILSGDERIIRIEKRGVKESSLETKAG